MDNLNAYTAHAQSLIQDIDNAGDKIPAEKVANVVKELKEAYAELYKTMNLPEKNRWYVIKATDPNQANMIMSTGGPYTHAYGNSYSYVLEFQTSDVCSTTPGASWTINADENTGRYVLQNARTGGYFGPYTGSGNSKYDYHPIMWYQPKSFTIVPLGEGQVGFVTAESYFVKGTSGVVMDYAKAPADNNFKNTGYAWVIEPTDENHSDLTEVEGREYCAGRVIAFTKPYEIDGLPVASNADGTEEIPGYEIIGKETAGENSNIITAYKLKAIGSGLHTPAGKPIIYIMPGEYNTEINYNVTFTPVLNTPLKLERDTVNGLVSIASDNWNTSEEHMGYFLADSVVDEPKNLLIGYQRAVIVPRLVKNVSDEEPDAIVYVKGAGMLNKVKPSQIIAVKRFVNVYSVDGTLLRRHVDASAATQGLSRGIYIVGNKKVMVK